MESSGEAAGVARVCRSIGDGGEREVRMKHKFSKEHICVATIATNKMKITYVQVKHHHQKA